MKEISFILLLLLILINFGCGGMEKVKGGKNIPTNFDLKSYAINSSCDTKEIVEVRRGKGMITNFDFDLEPHIGKNITVYGIAVNTTKHHTQNYNNLETLESSNGFRIYFKPREGKSIKPGSIYIIEGTVIKDREKICDSEPCEYEIFLLEAGP